MGIFEWDLRAEKYDNLEWTNRDQYMGLLRLYQVKNKNNSK